VVSVRRTLGLARANVKGVTPTPMGKPDLASHQSCTEMGIDMPEIREAAGPCQALAVEVPDSRGAAGRGFALGPRAERPSASSGRSSANPGSYDQK